MSMTVSARNMSRQGVQVFNKYEFKDSHGELSKARKAMRRRLKKIERRGVRMHVTDVLREGPADS